MVTQCCDKTPYRMTTRPPRNPALSNVEPAVQTTVRSISRTNDRSDVRSDWIASEAPLEVRIDGRPVTVLMRTPGHDEELVRGFLYNEGVVSSAGDFISVGPVHESPEDVGGSVINVQLAPHRQDRTLDRAFYSNASCGVCGKKTIESLEVKGAIAASHLRVEPAVLNGLPEKLRDSQATFAQTGGVHASGLFTPGGELVLLREDVGRHNALDKIIGWALAEGRLPLADHVLLVSGRVSYEIVQKAVVAGIPFIAAVGAPSSLAVDLAERFGLTLVGFLKPDRMNVYAHPERIGS
jgi:FdhD protein